MPTAADVQLRPVQAGDLAVFRALYADPVTMRHIAAPLDEPSLATLFARAQRLPGVGYRVIHRATHREIEHDAGAHETEVLGLGAVFGTGAERELGLMLLPAHAGVGYGRPALQQLIALARADGVTVLRAKHARAHRAVAWLLAACGFSHAGDDDTQRHWRRALL